MKGMGHVTGKPEKGQDPRLATLLLPVPSLPRRQFPVFREKQLPHQLACSLLPDSPERLPPERAFRGPSDGKGYTAAVGTGKESLLCSRARERLGASLSPPG